MSFIIISLTAFLASLLTLYSGFGLGTLLMPVIAIFFPVSVAIAITAFVHLLNNFFKALLLRHNINWKVAIRFGVPAMVAAIPGAWLLTYLSGMPPIASYHIFTLVAVIEPIKIIIGILLIFFATLEWITIGNNVFFRSKWLAVGGLISGFFGGLSGQQGAFRSPFLLHSRLTKEQFVGTNAGIAVMVDTVRLFVYGITFQQAFESHISPSLITVVVLAACLGGLLGIIKLKKVTFTFIQRVIVIMLYILGLFLITGII